MIQSSELSQTLEQELTSLQIAADQQPTPTHTDIEVILI